MNADSSAVEALEAYDPAEMGPRRRSSLAIAALVVSVLPVASFAAPVLAIAALVSIRRNAKLDGVLLAWAGLILGTVVSAVTLAGAFMQYRAVQDLVGRPRSALLAALAGDSEGFRAQWTKPGSEASAADIAQFADQLRRAHGQLQEIGFATDRPAAGSVRMNDRQVPAAFIARFDRGEVPLLVLFEAQEGGAFSVGSMRIRRLTFGAPGELRIVFPDDEPIEVHGQPGDTGDKGRSLGR